MKNLEGCYDGEVSGYCCQHLHLNVVLLSCGAGFRDDDCFAISRRDLLPRSCDSDPPYTRVMCDCSCLCCLRYPCMCAQDARRITLQMAKDYEEALCARLEILAKELPSETQVYPS